MKNHILILALASLATTSTFAETLTTTFAGGIGNLGAMFDIVADQPLTIDALQFATADGYTGAGSVEIYTKSGTHVGSEGDAGAWTSLGVFPYAAGPGLTPKTPVSLPSPIILAVGERRAFYIRNPSDHLALTAGDGTGSLEASNGKLRIYEGKSVNGTFGADFAERIPNVTVHYTPTQPNLLTTTFAGGNSNNGIMFDLVAKSSLRLTSVQFATSSAGARTFDLYTRVGTHVGFENNGGAWTFLRSVTFQSDGVGFPIEVGFPQSIPMAKGETRAFYLISATGDNISYSNGGAEGVGNVEAFDAHLSILKGTAQSGLFTSTGVARVPNVAFRYADPDKAAPKLTIVGPKRIRSVKPRATIYGIATDDVAVANVLAKYRRATPRGLGASVNKKLVPKASGLFKLTLKLAPKRNPVTFRAFDRDGRTSAPVRVTVIH